MTRRLADNLFLSATIAGASIAWLIAFIGACIFRRGVSGGAWWIIVYQLLLILAISAVLITNTYAHYRMMILTLLAASISLLTLQLDYALPTAKFNPGFRSGASAHAAGYIILIIIEFLWVIVFGSEPESYIGRLASIPYGNAANIIHNSVHRPSSHHDKDSAAGFPPPPEEVSVGANVNAFGPPNIEYKEKVQALHAYQANPEDPNELSFSKGESLDILERNGNWWQARKSDGSVGIIPSNYFGSSG